MCLSESRFYPKIAIVSEHLSMNTSAKKNFFKQNVKLSQKETFHVNAVAQFSLWNF